MKTFNKRLLAFTLTAHAIAVTSALAADEIKHSDGVKPVPFDAKAFKSDPDYSQQQYDAAAAQDVYRNKVQGEVPRPLLELGRSMYTTGPFPESSYALGAKNPVNQQFIVYGDWQTNASHVSTPGISTSQIATRLNLDVDWKITATERLHALFRPLDNNGKKTQIRRVTEKGKDAQDNNQLELSAEPQALFFEGDLASLTAGALGENMTWDLPLAVGLMPLVFQNGVWLDDAFTGIAFTLPARNSAALDISNYDLSFFAGFDKVSSAIAAGQSESKVNVYGATAFVEANQGYWEFGYGFTQDTSTLGDQSYHNVAAAFTQRHGTWLSNSLRMIGNFGQQRKNGAEKTADGVLLLAENSLITRNPTALVPYFNLFAGFGRPQSLARDAGAGGVLKNTGITFESAGLSGNPTLDATGHDSFGGALGIEYLFSLNQQIVVELGAVIDGDTDKASTNIKNDQFGLGLRYQRALDKAWIVRGDVNAIYDRDTDRTRSGFAIEVKRKF